MQPQPDQQDQQPARQAVPRHAPQHSRQQRASPVPANVLAPDGERLAARSAAEQDALAEAGPAQPGPAEAGPAQPGPAEPGPLDTDAARLREHLEAVRLHAQHATSWLETSSHYARLVNRDGVVPVTARFTAHDLAFLAEAREQMAGFAELGIRLIELHQPLDAGGISSDPAAPILRCRSCMWRWPCPTFRTLTEVLDGIRPG